MTRGNPYECSECGQEQIDGRKGLRIKKACHDCEAVTTWVRADKEVPA